MPPSLSPAGGTAPRPTLLDRPGPRAALVAGLYGYQGLVAGFAGTALTNHYAALGLDAGSIGGHLALAALPWMAQPLWGPVVDRLGRWRMGRRRGWIVLALLLSLLALSGLLAVGDAPEARVRLVAALFCAHSAAAALMDTATDALIIDRTPPESLGRTNAVTRAGFVTGGAVGAALFSHLIPAEGFRVAVLVLLAASALTGLLPLLLREAPGDALFSLRRHPLTTAAAPRPAARAGRTARRLVRLLGRPAALGLLLLCFGLDWAAGVFGVPFGVALIQAEGWDPAALSRVQAGVELAAGTLGALGIGLWTDRVGPERALTVLLGAVAAGFALAATLAALDAAAALGPLVLGLTRAVPTLLFAALAPAVMRASRGAMAATRFAVFMAALNAGDIAGAASAGPVSALLGPVGTATQAAAAFALAAIAVRAGMLRPLLRRGGG